MPFGAFTDDIDLIQVLLGAFFLFFAVLVLYLRREDKREGYPLVSRTARHRVIGWPAPPPVKTYRLMEGGTAQMPHAKPQFPLDGSSVPASDAAPLRVVGDPVLSWLGAGATVLMRDEPMRTLDGEPLLRPLRTAKTWKLGRDELDPRGMRVLARNFQPIGTVSEIWVDTAAKILRYLEVTLDGDRSTMLLPIYFADIRQADRQIRVKALQPHYARDVPRLADRDIMTAREEDRITAFFAGGTIYVDPAAVA